MVRWVTVGRGSAMTDFLSITVILLVGVGVGKKTIFNWFMSTCFPIV